MAIPGGIYLIEKVLEVVVDVPRAFCHIHDLNYIFAPS